VFVLEPNRVGVSEKDVGRCGGGWEAFRLEELGAGFVGGIRSRVMMGGFVGCGCPVVYVSILDAVRTNQPKEMWKEARETH
jgi:hypothetical protein